MKRFALQAMRACGMFSLARAMSGKMARILMYHNFSGPGGTASGALSAEATRAQFNYLRRHYRVVPLLQIAAQLATGQKLDPYTVALTIDDGRRDFYEFMFPLLKEFQFPATFFVVSSFIRGEDWIWTDKVAWLSQQPNHPPALAAGKLDQVFRSLNLMRPEARNAQIHVMAESAGITIPSQPPTKYAPCTWSELREMADSGLVDIGSHTVTHPILSSISDEESWQELKNSRDQIEEGMERKPGSFCFPNGMPGDFRPTQIQQIAEAGYTCSVVASFGMVSNGADPYRLPRLGMGSKSDPIEFSKFLDGVAYYQRKLAASLRRRSQ
ncbi:MAG TPA: polysaccharide deacetylase family protein [Terriglobales bacterium]|nr:polysaccharide deacetylase family protein [Terriglobales bacterium]